MLKFCCKNWLDNYVERIVLHRNWEIGTQEKIFKVFVSHCGFEGYTG